MSKVKKGLAIIFAAVVGIVLISIVSIVGYREYLNKQHAEEEKAFQESVADMEPQILEELQEELEETTDLTLDSATMQSTLASAGELVTERYTFSHVESFEDARTWFHTDVHIPFTTKSYIIGYDGEIKAGLDWSLIQIEVDEDNKEVIVSLPLCKITSVEIFPDSFKLYEEKNNIFNPIKVEDLAISISNLENDEREKAIEKGVLDEAEDNAKTLIETTLRGGFDLTDYEFVFKKAGA